jgi:hypothetical protein
MVTGISAFRRWGFIVAAVVISVSFSGWSAKAQSVFCPSTSSIGTGAFATSGTVNQSAGTCTNGLAGAFSGAALASQALGDLASSTSQTETTTMNRVIQERREKEAQACPPGETKVDGVCQAPPRPQVAPSRPVPMPRVTARRPKARVHVALPAPHRPYAPAPVAPTYVKPAPSMPVFVDTGFHLGTWAEGYGDYEHRSGSQSTSFQCCTAPPAPFTPPPVGVTLDVKSSTTTAGFLGGLDATRRNLFNFDDGVILGLTAGYMSADVDVKTSVLSTDTTRLANGSSTLHAHLDGPSLGMYATYFNGPFSNDFLIKNDFLSLGESFSDTLAFGRCACFGSNFTFTSPFAGAASTHLDQLTVSDNVNYRVGLSPTTWIEPTGGVQYTLSSYDSSAAALGLKDGYTFRLQGGTRFGFDSFLGGLHLTTSLTGLVLDDVTVHGDFVQGGAFGTNAKILSDQGKVQGEGILALNFDWGRGITTFVQGDVRGGDHIFGVGGKGGIRVQW